MSRAELESRLQGGMWFYGMLLAMSLLGFVFMGWKTYTQAIGFTQEKITFERAKPHVFSMMSMNFENVRLTTWSGKQILRDVWVRPSDPDDPLVDIKVDSQLSNELRLTVTPEFSSHIIPFSTFTYARHVTLWVPNAATKEQWDKWIAEQMESYRRAKGI